MSKFIKLTNILFNTNDIHKIIIKQNKYHIHIISKKINGFYCNFNVIGSGYISSYTEEIEVCKIENSDDYKKVSNWISDN